MTTQVSRGASENLAPFSSVPRDVALTRGGIAMVALSVVLAAGALAAAVGLWALRASQQAEAATFERNAVGTTARVVRVGPPRGDDRRRTVTFRYDATGSAFTGTATLSQREWRGRSVGGPLDVEYLASDPQRVRLAGRDADVLPMFVIAAVVPAILTASGLVAWRVRRDWVLLSEGRFTRARIIDARRVARQHHRAHRVRYEFQTLSGATVTKDVETGRQPPAIGDAVTVVYHRDDPRWTALYPLPFVRPGLRDGA